MFLLLLILSFIQWNGFFHHLNSVSLVEKGKEDSRLNVLLNCYSEKYNLNLLVISDNQWVARHQA